MEKLIISKELADEVKKWRGNVADGIKEIVYKHAVELLKLGVDNGFCTAHQISAYLLGGQDRVYEVKNDPYIVVWNTDDKEFYQLPYNYPLDENEIVIITYDRLEDAEYTAEELNNSL